MNINGTIYELNRKSLEIYLSGCKKPHCDGCHNPELWDFDNGISWKKFVPEITDKINNHMVDEIWILGGEPLDQNKKQLIELLSLINLYENVIVYLFTRYEIMNRKIFNLVDYVKTGKFDKELDSYYDWNHNIELASWNQKIIEGGKNGRKTM